MRSSLPVRLAAAASGLGPAPAREKDCPALGGVQPSQLHGGQQHIGGLEAGAGVDGVAASGAVMVQEPLVGGAGENEGEVVMRLQIPSRIAMLFPSPARAVGGTAGSLSDFTIRCDHDQHLITAVFAALETPRLLD